MRLTRTAIEEISRLHPEEMTYENTFGALEKSNDLLTEGMCKAYVLKSLCDSGELRKAMDSVAPRVSAFLSSVTKDQALWKVLKTAEERLRQTHLSPEQERYMELSMQSFRDNGADLPPDKRARLESIDRELTLASQRFNNLYMDARKSWTWTVRNAALLEGIDGSALQQAREEFLKRHPGQSGPGWTFTLDSAASARVMEKPGGKNAGKIYGNTASLWLREHATRNPSSGKSSPCAVKRRICADIRNTRITPCARAWRKTGKTP